MNGISFALSRVHHAENRTHRHLLEMAEKHADEVEIRHVAIDIAEWSEKHVGALARAASELGMELDDHADRPTPLVQEVRSVADAATAHDSDAGIMLLTDLCELFLRASDASLQWEMLAQTAQAERHADLLGLTEKCHPQTLRQIRWTNTMLKSQTPQILAALSAVSSPVARR